MKLLILLCVLSISVQGFSQEKRKMPVRTVATQSDDQLAQFALPTAGQWMGEFGLQVIKADQSYYNSSTSTLATNANLTTDKELIGFKYGISDDFALGFKLSYGSSKITADIPTNSNTYTKWDLKGSGLYNPEFLLATRHDFSSWVFFTDNVLEIKAGSSEVNLDNSTQLNNYSGRSVLTLKIGAYLKGEIKFGSTFAYSYKTDREYKQISNTVSLNSNSTYKGGNSSLLELFAETSGDHKFGGSYFYLNSEPQVFVSSSGNSSVNSGSASYTLMVYSSHKLGDSFYLIPTLGTQKSITDDIRFTKYDLYLLSLTARLGF